MLEDLVELERGFTKFGEITQNKGHYAVSMSPILVQIKNSYTTSY